MKNKFQKIKNLVSKIIFSKKLHFLLHIGVIFLFPLILATPIPFYRAIYKLKLTNEPEIAKEIVLPQNIQSMGTPLFSKISGIETYVLPAKICTKNRNEVILDKEVKNSETLVDGEEAGAMEITIKYSDGSNVKIYTPRNKTICEKLKDNFGTTSSAYLANNPVFRHAAPIGQPFVENSDNGPIVKVPVYETTEINSSDTRIFVMPEFKSKQFIFNIIIFFLAWSFIYLHIIQLTTFVKKHYKDANFFYDREA